VNTAHAPQLLLHMLASIHPTYRANTSPLSLLPDTWRSTSVTGGYDSAGTTWPPDSAVPELSGKTRPLFDDLRVDELANRRKANAVFVVLGEC
jgi:alpha 1,2-mannosyltransferase